MAADGDAFWEFFEARCLAPFEAISAVDVSGLKQDADGIWVAPNGFALEVTNRRCSALGGPAESGLAARLASRQPYDRIDSLTWQSNEWREPRIEVSQDHHGLSVWETDLES